MFLRTGFIVKTSSIGKCFASTATKAHPLSLERRPLFDKILIANRGEIACRIMRTSKKLGVKTVAVYSEMDKDSMHTQMADEAYYVGKAPSSESYLRMDKIIEIAKKSGAQAIHPGYGFLSENAEFAEKVTKNGLVFIGPPSSAIIAMGSKSASKSIMTKANVPVVPGYHGQNQDPEVLKKEADTIGYPVLIKAVKGGGGKGMRIVEKPEDFDEMLNSSKREAMKSFGDDRVLVEKYLVRPRHVEVQVFCDTLGNAVYLFERDCSVQRRHQKIIEEAPAPFLTPEIRESLGKKAVAAAKAVNYVGAGTVEFIMDADTQKFYFMEMNTRLQVEHPVTEMITGTDLVQWQLEVASGNRLPLLQDQLRVKGHSFEARIYAENPKNNFLPDTGTLVHLETPEPSDVVRVETGVRKGDTVSVYYDPMIAKLVVWGENREQALKKLRTELSQYQVVGLKTNIEFLLRLIENKGFIEGDLDTGFIKKYHSELFPPEAALSPTQLHSTVASLLLKDILSKKSKNPWDSPFALNSSPVRSLVFQEQEKDLEVECRISNDGILLELASESGTSSVTNFHLLASDDNSAKIRMNINEESKELTIVEKKDTIHVFSKDGNRWQLKKKSSSLDSARSGSSQSKSTGGDIKAPMPSKISQIMIKPGQQVKKGTPLVILEAMKMEHVMRAAQDGVVDKVRYNLNDLVQENEIIISFQKEEKK